MTCLRLSEILSQKLEDARQSECQTFVGDSGGDMHMQRKLFPNIESLSSATAFSRGWTLWTRTCSLSRG